MSDDLISRQAAIDVIEAKSDEIYKTKQSGATFPHDDFFQGMAYAADIVANMPSEPQWIPVTERLPKPNETVGRVLKHYLVQNIYGDMLVCTWDGIEWAMTYSWEIAEDVVAWMPLPEPYKRSGDENNDQI